MYELITRGELYEHLQPVDVYHGVTRGQLHPDIPDNAPTVLKLIMTKCFEFDPDKRPVCIIRTNNSLSWTNGSAFRSRLLKKCATGFVNRCKFIRKTR